MSILIEYLSSKQSYILLIFEDCVVILINRAKKYFLNALILSCASLILRAIGVAFNARISSYIGSAGMGLLTLTAGIYGFAITFACSGINLAVVRLVSSDLAKGGGRIAKTMRAAVCYCLFFSISASVILFSFSGLIGGAILGDSRVIPSIRLFAISLPAISISSAINGYFCAVRRVYKNVLSQFLEQGIRLCIVSYLLILMTPSDLELACAAVVGGGVISEIGGAVFSGALYFLDRKIHSSTSSSDEKTPSKSELSEICSVSLPVAISAYARSALSTLEHLAIPWGLRRRGLDYNSSISSYGVLHGMAIPLLLFPSAVLGAFSSLLIPELSEAYAFGNNARIRYIVSRVFALSLLFSVGVSGIFISFSYEIGTFIYGSREAGEYIRLLAPLIPLMYLDGAVDAMLKGLGEQLYTMRVNISDSLISLILIIFLLPRLGISGYVVVIFITEMFNTSFSIIKLLNITGVKTPVMKWVVKPLFGIVLSTLAARFLLDHNIITSIFGLVPYGKGYVFFEIGITAIIYIIISRIIGTISKDDVEWGKRLLSNAK